MNTEQKIKEAFDDYCTNKVAPCESWRAIEAGFRAGYLTLLNSLEPAGFVAHGSTLPKNERVFEHCSIMTKEDADEYMPECVSALFVLPEGVTKP